MRYFVIIFLLTGLIDTAYADEPNNYGVNSLSIVGYRLPLMGSIRYDLPMWHAPIEFMVTDPNGVRTGFNADTNTIVQDIHRSSYSRESIVNAEHKDEATPEEKLFLIYAPVSGHYAVTIIGTSTSDFGLEITAHYLDGNVNGGFSHTKITGHVEPGAILKYDVNYSSAPGSKIQVVPLDK